MTSTPLLNGGNLGSAHCRCDVPVSLKSIGHLLALHVTPANVDDRAEVARLADAIQDATGESVTLAYVDQGYTGEKPAEAAKQRGITLEVVKLPEAKCGCVPLPRRWVVERSFGWATRCRRLVKDYERYASTLAGLDVVAFVCFMLRRAALPAAGCITPSRARARMQCAANAGRSVGTTGGQSHAAPCASMLTATSTITGMNSLRTHAFGMRTSTLAPIIAPSSTPSATGAAIVGSMSPR